MNEKGKVSPNLIFTIFGSVVMLIIIAYLFIGKNHLLQKEKQIPTDNTPVSTFANEITHSETTSITDSSEEYESTEDEGDYSEEEGNDEYYSCDPVISPSCSSSVPWPSKQVYCFDDQKSSITSDNYQSWIVDFTAAVFNGNVHYFCMRRSSTNNITKIWLEELIEKPNHPGEIISFTIDSIPDEPRVNLRYMCVQGSDLFYLVENKNARAYTIGSQQPPHEATYPITDPTVYLQNFVINPQTGDTAFVLGGTSLVLNVQGVPDTLLHQDYEGDWSIDHCCFSSDGKRLYFDNYGPVACIWEYDLQSRRLLKIVPEHEAEMPCYLDYNDNQIIVYCEENCIKSAIQP